MPEVVVLPEDVGVRLNVCPLFNLVVHSRLRAFGLTLDVSAQFFLLEDEVGKFLTLRPYKIPDLLPVRLQVVLFQKVARLELVYFSFVTNADAGSLAVSQRALGRQSILEGVFIA